MYEERLPNETLENAIHVYKNAAKVCKELEDEDYSPVLDKVTIRFLKELQRYRAIGTVDELQALKEKGDNEEKYKLALFETIRNRCFSIYRVRGKSIEEINEISLSETQETLEKCNFDKIRQVYEEALAESMKGSTELYSEKRNGYF